MHRARATLPLIAGFVLATTGAHAAGLPPDVAAYAARRDRCEHWRGEASDDPGRAAQIGHALLQECRGSDAALARLRRRHARNRAVMRRLDGYDPRIER